MTAWAHTLCKSRITRQLTKYTVACKGNDLDHNAKLFIVVNPPANRFFSINTTFLGALMSYKIKEINKLDCRVDSKIILWLFYEWSVKWGKKSGSHFMLWHDGRSSVSPITNNADEMQPFNQVLMRQNVIGWRGGRNQTLIRSALGYSPDIYWPSLNQMRIFSHFRATQEPYAQT